LAGQGTPPLRLYASAEAHSSIEKAAIAAGIGRKGLRRVPVDSEFRMDVRALAGAIEADLSGGLHPFCVVATVGTTSTASVDPVHEIAEICRRHGLWLHIDGAHGAAAGILPEMRWILEGAEKADSLVTNPHKWLFVPADCSALYTSRPEVLKSTFTLVPEYLKTTERNVKNYMDYSLQLGRRFRSLKLWMVLRYFGVEGLRSRIREHIRLAKLLASWVNANADFVLVAPVVLNTVCFRVRRDDQTNRDLLQRINSNGGAFLSSTRVNGRFALRLSIGNLRSTEQHVSAVWELIRTAYAELKSETGQSKEKQNTP
jgi:aromatic-L-amino-acid/L-tryptophan decarboxylase